MGMGVGVGGGVLEYMRGVAGSSGFGSSSTAEDVSFGLSLSHLTVIITGATSGIGAEAARVLAKRGARLVLPARNLKAAEAVKASILAETSGAARILIFNMDLSSLSSVRDFAARFINLGIPLNVLINNAGVVCRRYRVSKDGYEMDFATNHLGHFLLTSLLLEKMVESAKQSGVEGRIVNVSSSLHTWVTGKAIIDLDHLNNKNSFVESLNYANSKLANILHANELARRLKENGAFVIANSLHPGIVRTNITRDRRGLITDALFILASLFTKSIAQGAATLCYVAVHPKVKGVSGKYFVDCNEASSSSLTYDTKLAQELWQLSERLIKANNQLPIVNFDQFE